MQFLCYNLAQDSGDQFPVVPGLLRCARHEFGGGGSRQSTVASRPQPPPAPAPLAPTRPTQSVVDLLAAKKRPTPNRSGTILTNNFAGNYGAPGRRTILGTPIS